MKEILVDDNYNADWIKRVKHKRRQLREAAELEESVHKSSCPEGLEIELQQLSPGQSLFEDALVLSSVKGDRIGVISKGRVYLKPSEAPSKGASVKVGPRGGRYYETGDSGQVSEEPKKITYTPSQVSAYSTDYSTREDFRKLYEDCDKLLNKYDEWLNNKDVPKDTKDVVNDMKENLIAIKKTLDDSPYDTRVFSVKDSKGRPLNIAAIRHDRKEDMIRVMPTSVAPEALSGYSDNFDRIVLYHATLMSNERVVETLEKNGRYLNGPDRILVVRNALEDELGIKPKIYEQSVEKRAESRRYAKSVLARNVYDEKLAEPALQGIMKSPPEHLKNLKRLIISTKALWAVAPNAAGAFDSETNFLYYGDPHSDPSVASHEVGHLVYSTLLTPEQKEWIRNRYSLLSNQVWYLLTVPQSLFITPYSAVVNDNEWFAECYRAYLNKPETLWTVDPTVYKFLEKEVFHND